MSSGSRAANAEPQRPTSIGGYIRYIRTAIRWAGAKICFERQKVAFSGVFGQVLTRETDLGDRHASCGGVRQVGRTPTTTGSPSGLTRPGPVPPACPGRDIE